VYDVYDVVPARVYVPDALVLRYTLYPVAPETEDQLTVTLFADCAVTETFDGDGSMVVA